MSLSLKPRHLQRYKDVAALALKYRKLQPPSDDAAIAAAGVVPLPRSGPDPAELAADLEKLGPTFVKLGQLLSARTDLLPQPYLDALRRLQDKVEPFSYDEVEAIVQSELGARISKAFRSSSGSGSSRPSWMPWWSVSARRGFVPDRYSCRLVSPSWSGSSRPSATPLPLLSAR